MPIRRRSKRPRRSNTRTCPRLLTPQRTARRRLSHSPVGRAMAAAPTSTVIASKQACRETGTHPNVPSRPTSTASTWTTSQTGITVCWGKMMTGENHELTATTRTRRRPRPQLLLPEGRPVLREILLGRRGNNDGYPRARNRRVGCRRIRSRIAGGSDDFHRRFFKRYPIYRSHLSFSRRREPRIISSQQLVPANTSKSLPNPPFLLSNLDLHQRSHPSQAGAPQSCTRYVSVANGETCADVLTRTSLDIGRFYSLNPAVKADCSNLWPGKFVGSFLPSLLILFVHCCVRALADFWWRVLGYRYCVEASG